MKILILSIIFMLSFTMNVMAQKANHALELLKISIIECLELDTINNKNGIDNIKNMSKGSNIESLKKLTTNKLYVNLKSSAFVDSISSFRTNQIKKKPCDNLDNIICLEELIKKIISKYKQLLFKEKSIDSIKLTTKLNDYVTELKKQQMDGTKLHEIIINNVYLYAKKAKQNKLENYINNKNLTFGGLKKYINEDENAKHDTNLKKYLDNIKDFLADNEKLKTEGEKLKSSVVEQSFFQWLISLFLFPIPLWIFILTLILVFVGVFFLWWRNKKNVNLSDKGLPYFNIIFKGKNIDKFTEKTAKEIFSRDFPDFRHQLDDEDGLVIFTYSAIKLQTQNKIKEILKKEISFYNNIIFENYEDKMKEMKEMKDKNYRLQMEIDEKKMKLEQAYSNLKQANLKIENLQKEKTLISSGTNLVNPNTPKSQIEPKKEEKKIIKYARYYRSDKCFELFDTQMGNQSAIYEITMDNENSIEAEFIIKPENGDYREIVSSISTQLEQTCEISGKAMSDYPKIYTLEKGTIYKQGNTWVLGKKAVINYK